MCLQSPCLYPCCVCLSTALVSSTCTSVHLLVTHMRTHLPHDCHLSLFHSSGPACVLCKSCVFPFHLDVIARLLTDLETRRFGIVVFHIYLGSRQRQISAWLLKQHRFCVVCGLAQAGYLDTAHRRNSPHGRCHGTDWRSTNQVSGARSKRPKISGAPRRVGNDIVPQCTRAQMRAADRVNMIAL